MRRQLCSPLRLASHGLWAGQSRSWPTGRSRCADRRGEWPASPLASAPATAMDRPDAPPASKPTLAGLAVGVTAKLPAGAVFHRVVERRVGQGIGDAELGARRLDLDHR